MQKTEKLNLRLSAYDMDMLDLLAKRLGDSRGGTVRRLIQEGVERYLNTPKKEPANDKPID